MALSDLADHSVTKVSFIVRLLVVGTFGGCFIDLVGMPPHRCHVGASTVGRSSAAKLVTRPIRV